MESGMTVDVKGAKFQVNFTWNGPDDECDLDYIEVYSVHDTQEQDDLQEILGTQALNSIYSQIEHFIGTGGYK